MLQSRPPLPGSSVPLLPLTFSAQRSHFLNISVPRASRSRLWLWLAVSLCILVTFGCIHVALGIRARSTLVFGIDDLERIWRWEITHGYYPSSIQGLWTDIENPSRPSIYFHRSYLSHIVSTHHSYPSRPPLGSAADLDIIHAQCAFTQGQLVKDCLSFLSSGASLEPTRHAIHSDKTGNASPYIFTVEATSSDNTPSLTVGRSSAPTSAPSLNGHLLQGVPLDGRPNESLCDPENPRIFHMYWTGKFNDKPYLSTLSFLYTQNVGLSKDTDRQVCPPQLWYWINPGHAAALTSTITQEELLEELRSNPWSAPFMHPRFAEVIHFKLWDTTERLDGVAELRDDWRNLDTIFNSRGTKIRPHYVGGRYVSSSRELNKASTVLSDVARFVLCHQFGGTYLDTDILFLRDWEDLWGSGSAFAYRWSYHDTYNTAVLRLNKGSAIGTFLLRTALRNGFDFHPMSIYDYMEDAGLTPLLYRLPDALFDPAWLNTEGHQRNQPPHPYFISFPTFFEEGSANGEGFDRFFKGAYSYHYHNSWSMVVDSTQNYPNLGQRFLQNTQLLSDEQTPPMAPVLSWSATLKRTFEAYLRGEQPNMYGEWISWDN